MAHPVDTKAPRERAVLLAVDWHHNGWDVESALEELARLAETADLDVVGFLSQKLPHPNRTHYVGSGKLQQLKNMAEEVAFDVVLTNDELSPAQLRNLEEGIDRKVIDRTALILDIFARRARTREGRLQVELAQLEYRLPRLTRMWTHLSRQAVGGVGLRGPGETQLEADRREARRRIAFIKDQLEEVHRHRQLYRDNRKRQAIPVIGLVGYTNAGKSTLLNTLAGPSTLAEDKLFATLDPTTRRIHLPSGREALLTDTVGFINNLPTFLIAAFRATLEEILEANVLIHVVDVTHPRAAEQAETVRQVLEDLGADDRPIITALNKVDLIGDGPMPEPPANPDWITTTFVPISAHSGQGLDDLLEAVERTIAGTDSLVPLSVLIPYDQARLVDLFHRRGQVESEQFGEAGTLVKGLIPVSLRPVFDRYSNTAFRQP